MPREKNMLTSSCACVILSRMQGNFREDYIQIIETYINKLTAPKVGEAILRLFLMGQKHHI